MGLTTHILPSRKYIALMAHDHYRQMLMSWVERHQPLLEQHVLYATGTTGNLTSRTTDMSVNVMLSGPMGGDQQVGVLVSEGKIDVLIFFWNPLNTIPHDPDMKALLRLVMVWDILVVTSVATADFIIQLPHFSDAVNILIPDYQCYLVDHLKQYHTDGGRHLFLTVFLPPARPDFPVYLQRERDSFC